MQAYRDPAFASMDEMGRSSEFGPLLLRWSLVQVFFFHADTHSFPSVGVDVCLREGHSYPKCRIPWLTRSWKLLMSAFIPMEGDWVGSLHCTNLDAELVRSGRKITLIPPGLLLCRRAWGHYYLVAVHSRCHETAKCALGIPTYRPPKYTETYPSSTARDLGLCGGR